MLTGIRRWLQVDIDAVRFLCTTLLLPVLLLMTEHSTFAADGNEILGHWNTEERDAVIEIIKCGDKYCGRVAWVKEPNYSAADGNGKEGQPRVDDKNPDPKLRNRPIVGLQIMSDFSFASGNKWSGGRLYDPETGQTYSGKITLFSPDKLGLRGYVLFSLLGRTTTWTRAGNQHGAAK